MFDFSAFKGGSNARKISFLGLTVDDTKATLDEQFGLSRCLLENYPDITKRGDNPNAAMKCGIVWEANGRNCSYGEIAAQIGVSHDSAYQGMGKYRKYVKEAFRLNIEHRGDVVFIVTNNSLAEKMERVNAQLAAVERTILNLNSDVQSIKQSGAVPLLPARAAAILTGYNSAYALQAADESVAV